MEEIIESEKQWPMNRIRSSVVCAFKSENLFKAIKYNNTTLSKSKGCGVWSRKMKKNSKETVYESNVIL